MRFVHALLFAVALAGPAYADDVPGAGNAEAGRIAQSAAPVRAAMGDIAAIIAALPPGPVRDATREALLDPATCVRHRAGLDAAAREALLDRLIGEDLIAKPADGGARAALLRGLFPPLADDGSACPHLPQRFAAAPGGTMNGHHSWPGGLALHTAMNARLGLAIADAFARQSGVAPRRATIAAAALWHDWAKTIVFQWQADGREFDEISAGGTGHGDGDTPVHHILGLAEAMARGLPADQIIVQACAHGTPFDGNADKVIHWLRAAAIIARVDPVARGMLVRAGERWALAGGAGPAPRWRTECLIHFQSDQNFVETVGDAQTADAILTQVGAAFTEAAPDSAAWRWRYRHVALARLGATRIVQRWQAGGAAAVRADLARLCTAHAARKIAGQRACL